MKIRRILFCMATIAISQISMAQKVLTAAQVPTLDVEKQLQYCHKQIKRALAELQQKDGSFDYTMEPRNILKGDKQKGWNCRKATPEEWCDGFWPGILWMDHQNTKDEAVRKAAEGYTESLKGIAYRPCYDHDIGFLMFCSYGKGYEVNHSQEYKNVILASADSLATLFNPIVGTILSWPREVKPRNWPHNTIMDNMMNLDMMLWAEKAGIKHYQSKVLPGDKQALVKKLQDEGKQVAMVGDGINDTQALALANVSMAIGKGTDVAMDVAQITLMSDDLLALPEAVKLSQKTVHMIWQNLFWAFIYNIICIPLAAGVLHIFGIDFQITPMWASALMAFSSVSVVLNSLRLRLA